MRTLLPEASASTDLVAAYALSAEPGAGRPFVRCNMISTLDGAISLQGRSGLLGGPADSQVFGVLRSMTDVILVGSGTVRAEGYGPARMNEQRRHQRAQRGQPAVPPIAVVSGSGKLDWSSPFFAGAEARPIVFTTPTGAGQVPSSARQAAEIVVAGETWVQPQRILDHLYDSGYRSVLLEGGPGLNAEIVRAGLLDELCLTLSPRLAAGDGPRVLAGAELVPPLDLDVLHLLEEDGFLFYRLAVSRRPVSGRRAAD